MFFMFMPTVVSIVCSCLICGGGQFGLYVADVGCCVFVDFWRWPF